jgi:hypothetical protein
VPFPTGGIAAHDRFDAARRSARQARSAAGLPTDNDDEDLDLDLREGGLSMCAAVDGLAHCSSRRTARSIQTTRSSFPLWRTSILWRRALTLRDRS